MGKNLKTELTACEKEEAIQVIENEIGDVRMALFILEEKLRNTCLFNNLQLKGFIEKEIDRIPRDSKGQYTEEVLLSVYYYSCRFRISDENDVIDN
jgi:hypothetical protein